MVPGGDPVLEASRSLVRRQRAEGWQYRVPGPGQARGGSCSWFSMTDWSRSARDACRSSRRPAASSRVSPASRRSSDPAGPRWPSAPAEPGGSPAGRGERTAAGAARLPAAPGWRAGRPGGARRVPRAQPPAGGLGLTEHDRPGRRRGGRRSPPRSRRAPLAGRRPGQGRGQARIGTGGDPRSGPERNAVRSAASSARLPDRPGWSPSRPSNAISSSCPADTRCVAGVLPGNRIGRPAAWARSS